MSPVLSDSATDSTASDNAATDTLAAAHASPPRRAYWRLHAAAGVVAVGALLAGLALPTGSPARTVTGTVQLWQDVSAGEFDARCTGSGADADIAAGTPVRIRDANGEPLATSTLQPGRSDGAACVFGFVIPDVSPAGSYRVSVGAEDRPSTPFTYRDMHASAWDIRVVLGA